MSLQYPDCIWCLCVVLDFTRVGSTVSDQLRTTADNFPKVVVVGSYGVGLSLTMERMPEAGETVTGRHFASGHGGKGSNQAVAVARLGATAVLCSAVGSDPFGEHAKALWADEGVDCTMVRTLPGSTMVGVILVDAAGENRIALAPGVLADYTAECLDGLDAALTDADVLLVGLEIPVDTAHEALRIGRRAGVITILNPAPAPPDALPAGMLALADHVTPNRTEAARLAGLPLDSDPAALIGAVCFADVGTTVLTLGSDGALIRQGDDIAKIEAVVAPSVVDTTGAGDAFNGAYAVRLADRATPIAAARFAARAASWCVTKREVIPSLAFRRDLELPGGATDSRLTTTEPCPA